MPLFYDNLETLFEKYEELTEKFELLKTNISKNIDIILNKEESGTPLTSREVRNKKIYDTNSNAVSAYKKPKLSYISVVPVTLTEIIKLGFSS